ncbi:hypothetical protein BH10PLA1_BH10PLA1_21830 [soil metagenome]
MKRSRLIVSLVVAAVMFVAGLVWFSPSGTGEYADSPDGRYTAHASNLRRGTWLQGRVSYTKIEIVERSTGKTVWKADRYPFATEVPPDFGDRSKKFIVWAPDSRSVSIPVEGATDSVWAVP